MTSRNGRRLQKKRFTIFGLFDIRMEILERCIQTIHALSQCGSYQSMGSALPIVIFPCCPSGHFNGPAVYQNLQKLVIA